MLSQLFEPAAQHIRENFWTATSIQDHLSNTLKSKDLPTLQAIGYALKHLRWKKHKNNGVRGYYLKLR